VKYSEQRVGKRGKREERDDVGGRSEGHLCVVVGVCAGMQLNAQKPTISHIVQKGCHDVVKSNLVFDAGIRSI
jgi:hypothetical protein